ncbi:MAG: GNAT family N-acetyltransferase [Pseudomonadota bacterium]
MSAQVPTLYTQRLVLRTLGHQDADAIVRIAGDYTVSKWLIPVPYPYSLTDAHTFLSLALAGEEGPIWAITLEGRMIGVVGLDDVLGYYLDPKHWGQGMTSEAVAAVIAYRFSDPSLNCIFSGHFEGNEGSRRVLEKAGFKPTGTDTRNSVARKEDVRHYTMELTRQTWSALKQSHE